MLVDREVFDRVQERLTINKQRSVRNNRYPEAALLRDGFARCGYCGRTMVVCNAGTTYGCDSGFLGRCAHHKIQIKELDGAVWSRVATLLTQPETIRTHLAQFRQNDPTDSDLTAVDRAIAQVERQQANVSNAVALLEGDALTPLVEKLAALASQKQQLQAERGAIEQRRAGWEAAQQRLDDLEEWCRSVAEELHALDYTNRRTALDALGVSVKVYHRRHEPRYEISAAIPFEPSDSVLNDRSWRMRGSCSVRSAAAKTSAVPAPCGRPDRVASTATAPIRAARPTDGVKPTKEL